MAGVIVRLTFMVDSSPPRRHPGRVPFGPASGPGLAPLLDGSRLPHDGLGPRRRQDQAAPGRGGTKSGTKWHYLALPKTDFDEPRPSRSHPDLRAGSTM